MGGKKIKTDFCEISQNKLGKVLAAFFGGRQLEADREVEARCAGKAVFLPAVVGLDLPVTFELVDVGSPKTSEHFCKYVMSCKPSRRPVVQNASPVPDNWDKTQIPETGYSQISLQSSSREFKEVEALFCKTMRGFDIVNIDRIQNQSLWEAFQLQKNQMRTKNRGRDVPELRLFHGIDSKSVNTICHNNFDCRTHGMAYGKGSYFARDARYSHDFTGDADVRAMFISRVLVGDYTKGSFDYCQPPSKDGGGINFYDSCVDDVMDPTIFVVFEKHQIYPEYLIQYN